MEKYIENELLKAKKVDGDPMSALVDGYIEIVLKHLLNPKVDYSLSILVENRDGENTGTKSAVPTYFAEIKVVSSIRRKGNNIVDELQLSAYYPKYFRQVTVQNKMVLHLWVDDEKSVTLKLLLRSPLYYDSINLFGPMWNNEVVQNEMGKILPIWRNKTRQASSLSSSVDVYDDAEVQPGEGTNNSHEGVIADGNEKQFSVAAKEDNEHVLENAKTDHRNSSVEDDNEEPRDQEMLTDISIPDRQDGYTAMRNQGRTSFWIDQVFTSFEKCSYAIKEAAILRNAEIKFKNLGREKIVAYCSNRETCEWKIRVDSKGSKYVVTNIENQHSCMALRSEETANKLANPIWVCSHIIEQVRQRQSISTQEIRNFIKSSKYQLDITCRTAREAKKRALKTINGTGSKENSILGSQTELKRRRKTTTISSPLSSNAHQSSSNLRFLQYIPTSMHKYIQRTEDVEKDGHCGYRVISKQLGYEAMHGWKQVRRELLFEVVQNEDLYIKLSDVVIVKEMRKAFAYNEEHATDSQYWLKLLDAGYVIANAYKAVVVSLSLNLGCLTFLPLLEPPPEGPPHRIITFGFVNPDHFISVNLKPDAPIPRVNHGWNKNVSMEAVKVWEILYQSRFSKFEEIMGINQGNKNSSGGFLTV
ncbi:uncharacterized protein LOC113332385 [Papaver somniferum]|uniref:uncharacterized protein LOC113332385 n=1 Tax=Papaver somniferum TaxID=3469 RepID=UPI000E6FDC37|nr:uncharacterized protein LOC113332385 [Papaver somniferum]